MWRYSVIVSCSKGRVCGGGGSGAEDGILEGCVRTKGLWTFGNELVLSFACVALAMWCRKKKPWSSARRTSRRKETEAHAQQKAVAKLQLIQENSPTCAVDA